jgi:hypothetical protein
MASKVNVGEGRGIETISTSKESADKGRAEVRGLKG